ncbi:MAG: MFS transporter [Dehalococcoidia bacterium]
MADEAGGCGSAATPTTGAAGSARRPSLRKAFVAFRNPHFRWHWASTLASFSGMQMQIIALGILGWDLSGSFAVVGLLQAAFAIPMAVFSLPAGAAVDRLEKRQVVVASQALLGVLAAVTAVLIQADVITVVLLFVAGIVQGALFSVNGPARMALLSEIVQPEELTAAISLQNIAMNSTRVVAPAIAGLLIAFVSVEGTYYVTAVLYAFTVLAILRVPPTSAHVGRTATALRADIGAGVRYVFSDRTLRSLMLSGFAVALFIMPYQLILPGFADGLGRSELYGAMVAVSGVGGLIGSLGVASIAEHPRKPYVQFLIGLGAGASLVALGVLSGPLGAAGAFVALAAAGATATSYLVLNQTMLMTEADGEYRGRVMSISMLTFSAMPLMALPLGIVADAIGGRGAFVTQGLVATGAILMLALVSRRHTFSGKVRPGSAGA